MEEIFAYFTSPELQMHLYPIRGVVLFVSLLVIIYLVYFLMRSRWFKMMVLYNLGEFMTLRSYHSGKVAKAWLKILGDKRALTGPRLTASVVKVGDLFEKMMTRLAPFIHLNNATERLNYLSSTLSDLEGFTRAHQTYLQLKSGETRGLIEKDGHAVLTAYEQAFRDLQVIK